MSRFRDIPVWVKFLITFGTLLVSVTLAYAQLKQEDTSLKGEIKLLQQQDAHTNQSLEEIKQMLREEFDRHHPRR
jgi:chaperonin cofactor prefoldin